MYFECYINMISSFLLLLINFQKYYKDDNPLSVIVEIISEFFLYFTQNYLSLRSFIGKVQIHATRTIRTIDKFLDNHIYLGLRKSFIRLQSSLLLFFCLKFFKLSQIHNRLKLHMIIYLPSSF